MSNYMWQAKQRTKKLEETVKAREEKAVKEMVKRAVKAFKAHGQVLDFELTATPAFRLQALESYVEDLQVLREDLTNQFGDVPAFGRSSRWLEMELARALEQVVKLSIKVTKEG